MKKRRKSGKAKTSSDRRLHVSLSELHEWVERGEKLLGRVVARGGASKGVRARVHRGLVRLKGRTDRILESWEREMVEHLRRRGK
jgi:hypothetical protein